MKKVLAVVLAIAMIATLSISTFAVDPYVVEYSLANGEWAEGIEDLLNDKPNYVDEPTEWYFYFDEDVEADDISDLGFWTLSEDARKIVAAALNEDSAYSFSFVVEQTKGADIATVSGSVDFDDDYLKITVAPINNAKFVDLSNVEFKVEIIVIEKATGETVHGYAYYTTTVHPADFTYVDIDVTDWSDFDGGTCFSAEQCAEYSEILKGHEVDFWVFDFSGVNRIAVAFEDFQMYAPVNFVYTTSSEAEGYENVLCTIDFLTKSSVEGLGQVYVHELTSLAGLNLKSFSSDDEIKVYCDGEEVGVAEVEYDEDDNYYYIVFDLYHPTETTSYLGSYVLATAVAAEAEEDAANPETGASSMVNVAVALAAVSMAAVAFVATKKSK